jgi:hypothetical protein
MVKMVILGEEQPEVKVLGPPAVEVVLEAGKIFHNLQTILPYGSEIWALTSRDQNNI